MKMWELIDIRTQKMFKYRQTGIHQKWYIYFPCKIWPVYSTKQNLHNEANTEQEM